MKEKLNKILSSLKKSGESSTNKDENPFFQKSKFEKEVRMKLLVSLVLTNSLTYMLCSTPTNGPKEVAISNLPKKNHIRLQVKANSFIKNISSNGEKISLFSPSGQLKIKHATLYSISKENLRGETIAEIEIHENEASKIVGKQELYSIFPFSEKYQSQVTHKKRRKHVPQNITF